MKSPEAKLPPGFRFDREEANERSEPCQQSDQTSAEASAEISDGLTFAKRIHQRFKGLVGDDLVIPKRQTARPLPDLSQHSPSKAASANSERPSKKQPGSDPN